VNRTRITIFCLAGSVLAMWLAGCDRAPKPARPEVAPVAVRLAPVRYKAVNDVVEVTGTLYGEQDVTVSAKVPGRIETILVDMGDSVEPGATLAQIERVDYELAVAEKRAAVEAALAKLGLSDLPGPGTDLSALPTVARAKAQEANAKARLDRARQLFERDPPLLSAQDFADIETQWEVASTSAQVELLNVRAGLAEARVQRAALAAAEQRLADTTVVAPSLPLTFRIAARRISVGEQLTAGQALFRLVAMDRVKFRGMVPERYANQVRQGVPAQILVDGTAEIFGASVTRVAPAVDVRARTLDVEIDAANPEGVLTPGAFARARIVIGRREGAVFVPASAVAQFAGVQRLYTVKDGKAVEHRVRVGPPEGDLVEVLDAPALGEMVIDTPGRITAGVPVTTGR